MSALLTNLCEKGIVSEMLVKLWNNGVLQLGIWETIYMTVLSALFAYLIGLPLGMILAVTDEGGVRPVRWLNSLLGVIINFFRSIPCIILMVAMIPVARLIVHTSLGNGAVIVTLIIAAAPYVARMVESSIKEVNAGIIEAAQAKPSLIQGAVISTVTIFGYTALAATLGGTGLGQIAIIYGHQRSNGDITWLCVVLMVVIVQLIQLVGTFIARRTDKRIK